MRYPLDAITITGAFKEVAQPATGLPDAQGVKRHIGVDLRAGIGTKVYAPAAGVVTQSYVGTAGQTVEIRIGDKLWRFMHLSRRDVSAGQHVSEGQVIALSGNSGGVAAHLHVDARRDGTAYNASLNNYFDPLAVIAASQTNNQGGNEMAASSEIVGKIYRAVLQREPDQGGLNTYTGRPVDGVFNAIYGSAEANAVREREAAEDRRRGDLESINADLQGKLTALEQASGAEKQRLAQEVADLTKKLSDNQAEHQKVIGECTAELERVREEAKNKPPEIKEVVKEIPKVVWPNAGELSSHYPLGELVQAVITKLFGGKKG